MVHKESWRISNGHGTMVRLILSFSGEVNQYKILKVFSLLSLLYGPSKRRLFSSFNFSDYHNEHQKISSTSD